MHYFPQGIAFAQTFCNREKERAALKNSIKLLEHVVLVAPRRYGKTSLITQVLQENHFPSASIDFFFVLSQAEVIKTISEGVSKIMHALLPKTKTAVQQFMQTIAHFNPKISFNILGQKLELSVKQATEKSISEILLTLDHMASKAKKKCVLVFDEFQQIDELKENHAIEAAIRHAVERSQNVCYIFCGSKRHLLNEMFSDKSRPLYHLCDLMLLGRIHSESYFSFINKMAKLKWKQSLMQDVVQEILDLTENHPYYVNALCRRVWMHKEIPTLETVRHAWDHYVERQKDWMTDDFNHLTLNRRKVVTVLAFQSSNEPFGHAFSVKVGMNPSTIKKCLDDLIKLDIIYLDQNKFYRMLDPAMAYFIRQHANLDF